MKTYQEMIDWVIQDTDVRYAKWAAGKAIAVTFSVSLDKVMSDISAAQELKNIADKLARRRAARDANEARRLANIARKEAQGE